MLLMTSINYEFRSLVQTEINTPIDFVFKRIFDERIMKQWLSSPSLEFIGLVNVRGFKNEIGSQRKLVFASRKGAKLEMLETITAHKENKHLAFDLSDPYFNFHVDMKFEENNGGTLISESIIGKSHNHFFNAMMRIFGGKSRKVKALQYAKLKEVLEGEYSLGEEE